MLPTTVIRIKTNGDSNIEGMEHSGQCFKLKDLGRMAGKVTSEQDKEHTPVYQTVQQKGE